MSQIIKCIEFIQIAYVMIEFNSAQEDVAYFIIDDLTESVNEIGDDTATNAKLKK